MKKKLVFLLLLFTSLKLSGSVAIQVGGELSFPLSNYISDYLKMGKGGNISIITKKDFWPLTLEFCVGYSYYPLKDKPDTSFQILPVTAIFLYKLPFNIKTFEFHPFIETGINIEMLKTPTAKEFNTAFYSGLGFRTTLLLTETIHPGVSLKWIMVNERDETASFINIRFHIDFIL